LFLQIQKMNWPASPRAIETDFSSAALDIRTPHSHSYSRTYTRGLQGPQAFSLALRVTPSAFLALCYYCPYCVK
jgi:hypothetical protein